MHNITKRYKLEKIFKTCCLSSIILTISLLVILLLSLIIKSYSVFLQPKIQINHNNIAHPSLTKIVANNFLPLFDHNQYKISTNDILKLFSLDANITLKSYPIKNNIWLPASNTVGTFLKDRNQIIDKKTLYILDKLNEMGKIKLEFSLSILSNTDSREAESAGILGGIIGSILTITICILFAIPIGVLGALFIEEYMPNGILKNVIEININNLASVPSVVYGLLGLAILINYFYLPRSSSLVAGITLGLLTLPTIIITTKEAIRAVPQHIKQGALAIGASPMQVTLDYTLPLSLPGIITGCILSISRALGETAPLIMLGMVAFVPDLATNFTDPTITMPVLIYTWSDFPEIGFVEKTSAAILFLIICIISLNYSAIHLRNKYEHRW